jgi:hypothetical protein
MLDPDDEGEPLRTIEQQARFDGRWATAWAVLRLADEVRSLNCTILKQDRVVAQLRRIDLEIARQRERREDAQARKR